MNRYMDFLYKQAGVYNDVPVRRSRMYPHRIARRALRLGLLVALIVLALSACGGGARHRTSPRLKRSKPSLAPYIRSPAPRRIPLGGLRALVPSKPEPVTVGGVEGKQLDVVVEDLPKDVYGECGRECVDISSQSGGEQSTYFLEKNRERRVIVLEHVKGERVALDIGVSEASEFAEFMPEAQKVVDTVEWRGK